MATPTRELSIVYAGYTATNLTDFYLNGDNPDASVLRFEFEITVADAAAFAAAVNAARTAFRTPYQACTVTCRGNVIESFSHSSGTGFNSRPEITKERDGSSATSRFFTVQIVFGRPADVHSTSYRRNSTVRVTWTTDRRAHVEIDGVYTVNGSTSARDQYLAAIGTYASGILTALGGDFDLLEENVVNDDQNKVATFHRKYDEQIDGRNEATITIETLPNTRKRVTISGMYSTIIAATSSYSAYLASYPAFKTAVLGAIGGTFEETTTRVEHNDTDFVTEFTNVYDEMKDSRQDGSYQIIYATDRRITVIFTATYYTGTSGVSAYSEATSDFPTWASGILGSIGGTFNKRSESYEPNDIVPPNICGARFEFLEAYTSQAGSMPHPSIKDQNYKVTPFTEAPGDYPGAGVKRMVELNIEYTGTVDHTVTVGLVSLWSSIKAWLLATIVPIYQAGAAAIVEEDASYNPDNNIITGRAKVWISPAQMLMYKLEQSDSIDQGTVYDGLWTGDGMDYLVYPSHIVAIRKISKTYRRIKGSSAPIPIISTSIDEPVTPSVTSTSNGEGGDDPFGLGKLKGDVISREQRKSLSEIGIGAPGSKIQVEDITFTVTIRVTSGRAVTG